MLDRPSQHSSFSGIRTAEMCHVSIALIEASSTGPSQKPKPCTHMNSPPDRFAPRSRTVAPVESPRRLPDTCSWGGFSPPPLVPTVTCTGVDVAVTPPPSYALAVSVWLPDGG